MPAIPYLALPGITTPAAVCDYPAVADVEYGVTFNSGASTGTFVVPAEADVESGVTYGAAAEFTGTLSAVTAATLWDYLTTNLTTTGSIGALLLEKFNLITAGSITVSTPVTSGGNVTTIQGDDYDVDAGRQLDWDVSTSATVTGGAVSVVLSGIDTYTGSVVDADTVRLELTAAQTAAIPIGKRKYQVILTDTNGDVATLVEGTWNSTARVSE